VLGILDLFLVKIPEGLAAISKFKEQSLIGPPVSRGGPSAAMNGWIERPRCSLQLQFHMAIRHTLATELAE
jgi:hypothetical protein